MKYAPLAYFLRYSRAAVITPDREMDGPTEVLIVELLIVRAHKIHSFFLEWDINNLIKKEKQNALGIMQSSIHYM